MKMLRLFLGICCTACVLAGGAALSEEPFVVHEWGTFTAVADVEGGWQRWQVLDGNDDLPSFVYTFEGAATRGDRGYRTAPFGKGGVHLIRMETPVLYFYSDRERDVNVRVQFPSGRITEWYPAATSVSFGRHRDTEIEWKNVRLLPSSKVALPSEAAANHYYAAREVDAATVRIQGEHERFLFYRGVGDFSLPQNVRLKGNTIEFPRSQWGEVKEAIVFERRGERVGLRTVPVGSSDVKVERPELSSSLDAVYSALVDRLVKTGLYRKEAVAMVNTWKDSWFEDGLRVFYLLPTASTEAVLPLWIEPKPDQLVRVLVARVELLTPELIARVRADIRRLPAVSDARHKPELARLRARYGRFIDPLLKSANLE